MYTIYRNKWLSISMEIFISWITVFWQGWLRSIAINSGIAISDIDIERHYSITKLYHLEETYGPSNTCYSCFCMQQKIVKSQCITTHLLYAAPAMTCYPLFNSWGGEAVPYSFPHQSQKARTSFGDLRFDPNRPSYISVVWFTRRYFATAHLVLGWERLKHSGHYYCINTSKLWYKVVIIVCIHIRFLFSDTERIFSVFDDA